MNQSLAKSSLFAVASCDARRMLVIASAYTVPWIIRETGWAAAGDIYRLYRNCESR